MKHKNQRKLFFVVIAITATLGGALMARLRQTSSIDDFLGFRAERKFSSLPSNGSRPLRMPVYADYPWPSKSGGIAARVIQSKSEAPWQYRLVTREALLKMKPAERVRFLKTLSPAEKFDIARNRFDFPLVKLESERTKTVANSSDDLSLGWVLTSGFFAEPKPVLYTERNTKIEVPFSSSDVKALLSYYFQVVATKDWVMKKISRIRKQKSSSAKSVASEDLSLDPHLVHTILGNIFEKRKNSDELYSLGVEIQKGLYRSTRPLLGYKSDVRLQPKGNYLVKTILKLAPRKAPQWEPYGLFSLEFNFLEFEYELNSDSRGHLVSSQWLGENRILSLVLADEPPSVAKDYNLLSSLYQPQALLNRN